MSRIMRTTAGALMLAGALAFAPACTGVGGRVYVAAGPPVYRAEVMGVAPGPGYVWVPGYYRWEGRSYLWMPGRWATPPRPRAVWVPGGWRHDRHGWYWSEGRWR